MQLNTSLGSRADDVFGYDPAQRYILGYTFQNNLGIRGKYFNYDHAGTDPGSWRASLDMYNADLELFKKINLTNAASFEFSGGVRYNQSELFFPSPAEPNDFSGTGGIVGLLGRAQVLNNGSLYARGAFAILSGESFHDANATPVRTGHQSVRRQTELAMGYEHIFALRKLTITPHVGFEWLNLGGYQIDIVDEHPEGDMMLAGYTFGFRFDY